MASVTLSSPRTVIDPCVGESNPAAMRIRVVLPAPSAPISPVTRPASASKDTERNASTGGPFFVSKVFCSSRTANTTVASEAGAGFSVAAMAGLSFGCRGGCRCRGRRIGRHRGFDGYADRHAQAQLIVRVFRKDTGFIDQVGAQLFGFDAFGCEFSIHPILRGRSAEVRASVLRMQGSLRGLMLKCKGAGGARINGTEHRQVGAAFRERHKKRPFLLERAP